MRLINRLMDRLKELSTALYNMCKRKEAQEAYVESEVDVTKPKTRALRSGEHYFDCKNAEGDQEVMIAMNRKNALRKARKKGWTLID